MNYTNYSRKQFPLCEYVFRINCVVNKETEKIRDTKCLVELSFGAMNIPSAL